MGMGMGMNDDRRGPARVLGGGGDTADQGGYGQGGKDVASHDGLQGAGRLMTPALFVPVVYTSFSAPLAASRAESWKSAFIASSFRDLQVR